MFCVYKIIECSLFPNSFVSFYFFLLIYCYTSYTMVYGAGLGRELGTNVKVITSGGLGFRRDSLGRGFSPGVGRA
ncbi:hypothetical protein Hanom_Chr09g00802811 [Helianthus anomalus]